MDFVNGDPHGFCEWRPPANFVNGDFYELC